MNSHAREALETLAYGPTAEDPRPALQWLDARGRRFGLFIGNRWAEPASGQWFDTRNPATGELLGTVPHAGPDDVDRALRAAREALPAWRQAPDRVRARLLYAAARQVQKQAALLAVLQTLDSGKPIRESREVDVPLAARYFDHHAGWAQLRARRFPGQEPVGVVGQILPWNSPLLGAAWDLATALAAGCTVVLIPSQHTPLTALALCDVLAEVGLPPGVVNVVTGDDRAGELVVQHPAVDKVAFTGSAEVGRRIRQLAAGTGRRVSLRLGGQLSFVIFEDADLDAAVEGVVDAVGSDSGQRWCAGSRLLVQEGIADRLLAKLRARMEKLRVGDPLDRTVDMGVPAVPGQVERLRHLCQVAVQEGARMWQPSWGVTTEGPFFPPTLFSDVPPAGTLERAEIFGPVLVSTTFRGAEEAVTLANDVRRPAAASLWTENVSLALDVARRLSARTVWLNAVNLFDASGLAPEGMHEYLEPAQPSPFRWPGAGWAAPETTPAAAGPAAQPALPMGRTAKLYVAGRWVRPDTPYVRRVYGPGGELVGEVGEANFKDICNAVEAARSALQGWGQAPAHTRAQVLYRVAETLQARAAEFAARIAAMTGQPELAGQEVERAVERLLTYVAWCDKFGGAVDALAHPQGLVLALHEPVGVVGIACPDEFPLLAFVSLVGPAVALGNTAVAVPSPRHPLAITDLYQVLDTSDVPGGVVNILTGDREALAVVLAQHEDVDAVWYFGTPEGARAVEQESAGNLKRTWTCTQARDWLDPLWAEGEEFLRQAAQVKDVWIPHGD
ncbi:MAG: aldehyde dehydrogenase family protein [Armatimonadota bacterium]|nr:aldehyde dehydrogenase family protein [Armatimonadota bacterium]MDW8155080.1 aldehyde dehydrogenase family protein [Armatimonadota bacterium]